MLSILYVTWTILSNLNTISLRSTKWSRSVLAIDYRVRNNKNRPLRQQEPASDISEEIQCDNQSQEHCTIFGNSMQSKHLYGCCFYT
nr:MAG TPA: hypothetical protein [Caudoviricetes sp.]